MPHNSHPQQTLVMKFGGSSVGTPRAMAQAVQNIRQSRTDWARLVVVTSALSGVTNLLLESAALAVHGEAAFIAQAERELLDKHTAIAKTLIESPAQQAQIRQELQHLSADFASLCRAIAMLGEATPRALDAVASLGERMSVRLLAAALQSAGVPAQFVEATQLIVTDDHFQAAHPDLSATSANVQTVLEPILAQGQVPVVTGFVAATPDGRTTTLGRGGGDYSAAILGAALPADEVWIWTDVTGVMTADPRLVPEAQTIPVLTYREVTELAYFGAKVLHPKTIRPVIEAGISVRVCNTFDPQHPGTRVTVNGHPAKNENGAHNVAKAVTAIRGQRLIIIEGRGMLGVPGVAARAFGAVASTGTSVPLITQASSEQSICFAVPDDSADTVLTSLQAVFSKELAQRDIDRVWATEEIAIITVVGNGMLDTPGVAGQIFSALGRADVNVAAIAQGSSSVAISLVVASSDAAQAVRTLHNLIVSSSPL